jgi:ubiquinone/menaquinone biosynthesis C-methylase UbiE
MLTEKEYNEFLDVYDHVLGQSEKFLSRFPALASLQGKKILELGCGHGALCYDLVQKGASSVVGVDLDNKRIEFANRYFAEMYPELNERLLFSSSDIKDIADAEFDIIISKSTFEHVMDLRGMLDVIYRKLKRGGKLYSGFGPLYNSFDGDHKLITNIPWGHLFLSEEKIIEKFNKKTGENITKLSETTFNMLPFREYERIFKESDFTIEYFGVNVSSNPIMKLFSMFRFNATLREYFSRNIYCVLVKAE